MALIALSSGKKYFPIHKTVTVFENTTKVYPEDRAVGAKTCRRVLIIMIYVIYWCAEEMVVIRNCVEREAVR